MTGTTSRYGMTYPTGDNLVSELPSLMQNMCTSIDTALAQVDDRNNVGGVKPLVRRTLAELKTLQGVTGQTGYVTNDSMSFNNGMWTFDGANWTQAERRVVLYDKQNAAFNAAATLALSAENFDAITIEFKTDDGFYSGVTVLHPNGKSVTLTSSTYNPQGGAVWVKSKTIRINGTSLNTLQQHSGAFYTGQTMANGSGSLMYGDYIAVTGVIGIKFARKA